MDALRLIKHEHAHTDGYWMGALSMRIAISAQTLGKHEVGHELRETLAQFIASPVPSEELRGMLRGYLK